MSKEREKKEKEKKGKGKESSSKSKKKKEKDGRGSKSKKDEEKPIGGDPFEYGRAFMRYCEPGTNRISLDQFSRLMNDLKVPIPSMPPCVESEEDASRRRFNAGMLFEKFDAQKSGTISKDDFQRLYQELVQAQGTTQDSPGRAPISSLPSTHDLPRHVIDGQPSLDYLHKSYDMAPISIAYASPLPHLSALPGHIEDTDTALLRRDFVHLQGLLEATLAPRIESEVSVLERVEQTKQEIRNHATKVREEAIAEVENFLSRLDQAVTTRCKRADDVGQVHRKMLEKISQFQFLAAGPRPRDALRMDALPSSHFTVSCPMKHTIEEKEVSAARGDASMLMFQQQRERAQKAFHEQERFPHPMVMRDFVNLFKDFEAAAQRLVDTPHNLLDRGQRQHATGRSTDDALKALLPDDSSSESPILNEFALQKKKAKQAERLETDLKLKDQMIYSLVKERESFEAQKREFLQQVEDLAKAAAGEIKSWADLHTSDVQDLNARIAALQEENRQLRMSQ